MKKLFVFLVFCCLAGISFCQQHILEGEFKKAKGTTLHLHSFYGLKSILLDSSKIDGKGKFFFTDRHYKTGFYRISSGKTYVDCILEEGNTTIIHFEESTVSGKIKVLSGLNQQGLNELKESKAQMKKSISDLEKSAEANTRILKIREQDQQNTQRILDKYKNSFFAITSMLAMGPKPDEKILATYEYDTLAYFEKHFFDNVDFSNESLSRSTLLPNLYMRYLSRYVDYDEKGFKSAADLILSKARANSVVFNLSLEYLLELFEQAGPEIIFEYILDNYYLDNACQEINASGELTKKIARYQQLLPDQLAPVIRNCVDKKGIVHSTDSLGTGFKNKPVLVFFWSTHCHFCQELMQVLKQQTANDKLLLVGININEDKKEWMDFELNTSLQLLNWHAPGGWESDAARDYMVNKTPTIYLINEKGLIAKKNLSIEEVRKLFSN